MTDIRTLADAVDAALDNFAVAAGAYLAAAGEDGPFHIRAAVGGRHALARILNITLHRPSKVVGLYTN